LKDTSHFTCYLRNYFSEAEYNDIRKADGKVSRLFKGNDLKIDQSPMSY